MQNNLTMAKYPVEVSPSQWLLPDRVGFLDWIHETFKYSQQTTDAQKKNSNRAIGQLFVQQRFVRDFLQAASPYRGIVLFHGLGVGKSCASIAAAEALRSDGGRKIIIMTPASLKRNYIEEIKKCGARDVDPKQSWKRQQPDGTWAAASDGTKYEQLSAADQDEIQSMLSAKIKSTYNFFSYNGVTAKRAHEMTTGPVNMFDDTVLIIDEAHNFVSRVANNGLLTPVYQRIMDSPSCKVILLSGTPLINRPVELAYLIDLATGYTTTVNVTFHPGKAFSQERLMRDVGKVPGVDRAELSEEALMLRVKLLPHGFVSSAGGFVRKETRERASTTADIVSAVKAAVATHVPVNNAVLARRLALPVETDAFNELFVRRNVEGSTGNSDDPPQYEIINLRALEQRVVGCVSFYSAYDPAMYPRVTKTQLVPVPMSARQFTEYSVKRDEERRREETARRFAKRNAGSAEKDGSQIYRAYSRALCNFVFPEGIKRPYPADMRKMIDDAGDEDDAHAETVQRQYLAALDKAIAATAQDKDAMRVGGALHQHSPKFDAIIRHLVDKKHVAIVYSAFRRAEGIGILGTALLANGWARLYVDSSSNESGVSNVVFKMEGVDVKKSIADKRVFIIYDKADNEDVGVALLNAFNSDPGSLPRGARDSLAALYADGNGADLNNTHGGVARVLLLPPSGSEGLNLRNVREVHLMEPFWHMNRIDQVIGRAVRAGSHMALPSEERAVNIYMYVASFTEAQCKNNPTIQMKDKCMTSDQFVQSVARRKKATLDAILTLMRRAAVDCRLHSAAHQGRTRCIVEDSLRKDDKDFLKPRHRILVEDDVADASSSSFGETRKEMELVVAIDAQGTKVLLDKSTGLTYDYQAYKRSGTLISRQQQQQRRRIPSTGKN